MERFLITCEPTNESHIYKGKDFRISVLSDRLFRIELGKADAFEDRPTQTVLCRSFATPDVDFSLKGANLTVTTNSVVLKFNTQIKTVKIKDRKTNAYLSTKGNLGGTRRTLDMRLGAVDLGKGLMAKGGVSMFDDGKSLVLEGGMVVPRKKVKDYYIFAHNHDYLGCLKDFYNLTGKVPVIPKFALSNWWSRYFPYSEESYLALMDEFISRKIPITVATIDMDWHLVKEVPKEYKGSNIFLGRGWTGYTWNKKLFPDPQRFLKALKDRGFWTTLNIHPADGIRAFEDPYPEMARAMGIDPATKKTVEFDLTDKKFLLAYFDVLHRPFEKDGVDFWWIDWQQGRKSKIKGLDPLWLLNHYHYLDSVKNGVGLILSRYAELGSHRYPLGFSGDVITAWKSLKFQPYFTVNASNVGYGWWSHDIGGHILGRNRDELYLRWLQFGVFSPINRLHSSRGKFMGKEPWLHRRDVYETSVDFLRLRHKMLPYIYSMGVEANQEGVPLMRPLYYYADVKDAYKVKNAYYFGSEMIVCPVTEPLKKHFNKSGADVYLPEGSYIDYFTGQRYKGGMRIKMFRTLDSIPVLFKAGAIVPFLKNGETNSTGYDEIELNVYPTADGSFKMFDEDGSVKEFKMSAGEGGALIEISGGGNVKKLSFNFLGVKSAEVYVDGKLSSDGLNTVIDGGAHTVELKNMALIEVKPFLKRAEDTLEGYHVSPVRRMIKFYMIRRAFEKGGERKALKKIKAMSLRKDVKGALIDALYGE